MTRALHDRWPSASDEQLVRAALVAHADGVQLGIRWCAGKTWDGLSFAQRKLQPALLHALQAAGAQHPWHEQVLSYQTRIVARNAVLAQVAAEACRLLRAAGVESVLLKGNAAIARGVLRSDERPMDDVDLLVVPSDLDAALRALTAAGYRKHKVEGHTRYAHAIDLVRDAGEQLDLHRLLSPLGASASDEEALFARAERVSFAGHAFLVPSVGDQLLHACLSGFPAGRHRNLQWLLDAVGFLRAGVDAQSWDVLEQATIARQAVLPVRDALSYLYDVLEQPVPAALLQRLHEREPSARDRLCYATLVAHPKSLRTILQTHAATYEVGRHAHAEPRSALDFAKHVGERFMTLRNVGSVWHLPWHVSKRIAQRVRKPR